MPTYRFHHAHELTAQLQTQVDAIFHDRNNPLPVGFETVSLFGYQCNSVIVAWAWGSIVSSLGELHLIVLKQHQMRKLGQRLAMRYVLTRNSNIERYQFVVTNPHISATLLGHGFTQHPNDKSGFIRGPFSDQEIATLNAAAIVMGALGATVNIP